MPPSYYNKALVLRPLDTMKIRCRAGLQESKIPTLEIVAAQLGSEAGKARILPQIEAFLKQ